MNDAPQDRLRALLPRIREFVNEEAVPLEPEFLGRPFRELRPALAEKRRRVKQLGLWAPQLPEEYGGLGLRLEIGRAHV
jgi:acyl-CoA dehydrogenase